MSFTDNDILKLFQGLQPKYKQDYFADARAYIEEHKNDPPKQPQRMTEQEKQKIDKIFNEMKESINK